MHRYGDDNALRHLDFVVLDILTMQFSFMLMFWVTGHSGFIYLNPQYRVQAVVFFSGQMALGLFSDNYNGIVTRNAHEEFIVMLRYAVEIWMLCGVFVILANVPAKLIQMLIATLFYFDLGFFVRQLNKMLHAWKGFERRRVLVITCSEQVRQAVRRIDHSRAIDYMIAGICVTDGDPEQFADLGIPVLRVSDPDLLKTVTQWWLDDVFFLATEHAVYPRELMENFLTMGLSIHYTLAALHEFALTSTEVHSLGNYKVISNSVQFVSDRRALFKRAVDIAGGLAGTIMTGILFLFIAPAVYIKSPGPIFFSQERVGLNGRVFRMYKFRSMYVDAEKRKAELMAKNKIQDGRMFKMDDDPRIIGSEKKGKDGKPKGIGNFIRNTSLDEFPQFFNVLRGEMSLVGTRPPTVDEWNSYDMHHRARMSVKPGITGLWQVSGRSAITDFETVVELDRKYIENWSPMLDFQILLRTVKVVLRHEGAA